MSKSKSINVFLIDGQTTGRIKCSIQNWTGIAYKIPRNKLEQCKDGNGDICAHLKYAGIYFLLSNDQTQEKPMIYIGQAGFRNNGVGILNRLLEHKKDEKKPYYALWNEIICLTNQNGSFGATEISYLENTFHKMAVEADRYHVKNGNEPNAGNLTEEKESELEEYVKYAKIVVGVLGHNVFEPLTKTQEVVKEYEVPNYPVFSYKRRFVAKAVLTNEGFVLLKGSQISEHITESLSDFAKRNRKKYANYIDENRLTTKDILFASSSGAAEFVGGTSLSGNEQWKTEDNKSPKDF